MLIGAFDAGGTEDTPVLTVAGFVSSVRDWDNFSKLWKARLEREGITYFRAAEAAHFNKEFKPWRDKSDREQWRQSLFADLMEILKLHVYRKFGCTIINNAFHKMDQKLREEFILTAYSVAGRTCEKHLRQWINAEWDNPVVELVFEAGDAEQEKLRQRLVHDQGYSPVFKPKKDRIHPDGTVEYGFIPQQPADWLAYELSLAVKKLESGAGVNILRWPLQQFYAIPGEPGLYTVEDMEQFERMIKLSKDLIEWERSFRSKKKSAP